MPAMMRDHGYEHFKRLLGLTPRKQEYCSPFTSVEFDHKYTRLTLATATNHSSAATYPEHIMNYNITEELSHGALMCPFTEQPFQWCQTSPLMTREKKIK